MAPISDSVPSGRRSDLSVETFYFSLFFLVQKVGDQQRIVVEGHV